MAGISHQSDHRTDIDDAGVGLLEERALEGFDGVEGSLQIGIEDDIPVLLAHAQRQSVAGHPGIVDQNADRPQILSDLFAHGDHGVMVGNVHRIPSGGPRTFGAEFFRRGGGVRLRAAHHRDLGARVDELPGDFFANATSGPGDDGDPILKECLFLCHEPVSAMEPAPLQGGKRRPRWRKPPRSPAGGLDSTQATGQVGRIVQRFSMRLPLFRPRPACLLALAVLMVLSATTPTARSHPAHAQPVNHPLVIGFERFYSGDDDPGYLTQGGYLLLSELNCVSCHAPPPTRAALLTGHIGTDLRGAGARLRPLDLELMVRNPRFVKQDTLMPSLFAGPDRDLDDIQALTHFLASLREPPPAEALPLSGDAAVPAPKVSVDEGRRLYHRLGCVACHAPEIGYRPPDLPEGVEIDLVGLPSVPLQLAEKYPREELVRFLLDPLAHRPAGRMPATPLSRAEADHIAAYLQSAPPTTLPPELQKALGGEAATPVPIAPGQPALPADEPFQIDPSLIERGWAVFQAKNCAACHTPPPGRVALPSKARPLAQLSAKERTGCLSERPLGGTVPSFFLDEVQIRAIQLALADLRSPHDTSPFSDQPGRIDYAMTALNCYACHERGGKGGPEYSREAYFGTNDVGALSLGRWGNIPPALDLVGRKLTPLWMERVVTGQGARVRPYVSTRMPRFAKSHVTPLLADFTEADVRVPPMAIDVSGLPKYQRSPFGRTLLGVSEGGLGCVNCHGLKGRKSLGPPVIDLSHTVERLRPEYFKELLLDPQAAQPGTLMPPLFAGRNKADQEIEQIWTYLKELEDQRLPDGLLRGEDFELKPAIQGRPIVFRTFLEGVGAEAIAIGFPEGRHAAFDSRNCRWRLTWQGRFLDAMSTWDDRFCTPAEALGEAIQRFPARAPMAVLASPDGAWPDEPALPGAEDASPLEWNFQGFRLDPAGLPTLLYQWRTWQIADHLTPTADGKQLQRRVVIQGGPPPSGTLYFRGAHPEANAQALTWQGDTAEFAEILGKEP